MNSNLKLSGNILFKIVIVTLMAAFVCLSANIICMGVFKGEEIGYTNVIRDKEGIAVKSYNHYFADGDDKIAQEYEEKIVSKEYSENKVPLYDITKSGKIVYAVITQLVLLILLIAFIYSKLWKQGQFDENSVNFGHINEDKLRGLKIGLIANIPYFAIYIFLLTAFIIKESLPLASSVYAIANYAFSPVIDVIWQYESVPSASLQFVYMFLLLLVVPVVSCVSYILGYKGISLSEKLTYKKGKED